MSLLHIRLKRIKDLGKRKLTEEDFYRECESRGFWVHEMPLNYSGVTWWVNGITSITINSELKSEDRLRTMWHEFAHAYLHAPYSRAGARFSGYGCAYTDRQEREADEFMELAMLYGF